MGTPFHNPALAWFVQWFGEELVIGQVRICRRDRAFEMRHVEDWAKPADQLKDVAPEGARETAQFTEEGVFRPLKSAPTLRRGWRIVANSDAELETALNRLYPGAIADLYATLQQPVPITDYREFTTRQSGMYRITTFLTEPDAGAVVRKCCAAEFCLKRRFWDVEGHAPEEPEQKRLIPCLEPCAILLEYARQVVRGMQQEKAGVSEVVAKLQPNSKAEGDEG